MRRHRLHAMLAASALALVAFAATGSAESRCRPHPSRTPYAPHIEAKGVNRSSDMERWHHNQAHVRCPPRNPTCRL
jgi:hypothetical protein